MKRLEHGLDMEGRLAASRLVNVDIEPRSSALTSMSLSVLQRAKAADVCAEPFPHLVLRNALPDSLCNRLEASFPRPGSLGFDETKNNFRWDYHARLVELDPTVPALWKDFICYHVSANFF